MIGKEGAAAGFFGDILQNLVAIGQVILAGSGGAAILFRGCGNPLNAGANGVDVDAGALRHFHRFRASVIGKIVFAVADENHDATNRIRLVTGRERRIAEVLCASVVNRVINSRAASGFRANDLVTQHTGIAGKALNDLRLIVKGHGESLIPATAQNGVEKIYRSVLLKLEAVANAV